MNSSFGLHDHDHDHELAIVHFMIGFIHEFSRLTSEHDHERVDNDVNSFNQLSYQL